MKKLKNVLQFNKRMMVITIGLIIVGCITAGIGFSLVDYDIYKLNPTQAGELVSKEQTIPLQNMNSIHLDVSHTNVSIERIEGTQFQLQYEERKERPLNITTSDNKLSIYPQQKLQFFQFGWMNFEQNETLNLKLQIPKDYAGDFYVSTTYASLNINDITEIENFSIHNAHGVIDVKNIEAADISLSNSYGTTTVSHAKSAENFSMDNAHDAIDVKNVEAATISLTNSYGSNNVSHAKSTENFSMDNAHDEINIKNVEAGTISLSNSYGSTKANHLVSQNDIRLDNPHDAIELTDITAKDFSCDLSYSDIIIDKMNIENECHVTNAHANMTLTNTQSKLSQMDLSYVDLIMENWRSNDTTIDATHGNITGSIIGKEEEYHILSDVDQGESSLASERNTDKTKKLDVTLSYGDLDITFTGR